jgi:hypothetical protein
MHSLRKQASPLRQDIQLSSLYRSDTYPSGATRNVGNMHMHLDCSKSATSETRLVEIAKILEEQGWPSKVSRVNLAKPGLHLSDPEYAEEYSQHTPELCTGDNTFAAYLTTLLAPEVIEAQHAAELCKQAREAMANHMNGFSEAEIVIEVERVSALVETDAIRVAAPGKMPLNDNRGRGLFEAHHFVNMPHDAPVDFDEWQALCNLSGIVVGGWFQFDKEDCQALRSVRFIRNLDLLGLADERRELDYIVREHFGVKPEDAHIQTIVEQIVDIWRV